MGGRVQGLEGLQSRCLREAERGTKSQEKKAGSCIEAPNADQLIVSKMLQNPVAH